MASVYDRVELDPRGEGLDQGGVDLVVHNHPLSLEIQGAKRLVVAVDLVAVVVLLLRAVAREVEHQGVARLAALNKPVHCHSHVVLCWASVRVTLFFCSVTFVVRNQYQNKRHFATINGSVFAMCAKLLLREETSIRRFDLLSLCFIIKFLFVA